MFNDFISIGEIRSEKKYEDKEILKKDKKIPIFSIEDNIPNVKRVKKICDCCKNGEMIFSQISVYNTFEDCGFYHECDKCDNIEVYNERFPLLTDGYISEIIDEHVDLE